MKYLFPRSIILVSRQSFGLAMLATNTCLVAEWNLMPTIRGYVTQNKTKGYWTSRKSQLKIAFVNLYQFTAYFYMQRYSKDRYMQLKLRDISTIKIKNHA